jgi:hypothetical protein
MTAPTTPNVPGSHAGRGGPTRTSKDAGLVSSGLRLHLLARQAPWVGLAMLLLALLQAWALRRLGGEFDIPAAVQAFGPTLAVLITAVLLVAPEGEASGAAARPVQRWAVLTGGVLLLLYTGLTVMLEAVTWPAVIRNMLGAAAALTLSAVCVGVERAWVPVALYVAAVVMLAHPQGIDAAWAWPTASTSNTGALVVVGVLTALAMVSVGVFGIRKAPVIDG